MGRQGPAIPTGAGCNPYGMIREYDAGAGCGFIIARGFPEDIYFSRSALPTHFQGKNAGDMPGLSGVQVSFEIRPDEARAEEVTLLLEWHEIDECWLLKRDETFMPA